MTGFQEERAIGPVATDSREVDFRLVCLLHRALGGVEAQLLMMKAPLVDAEGGE